MLAQYFVSAGSLGYDYDTYVPDQEQYLIIGLLTIIGNRPVPAKESDGFFVNLRAYT